MTTSYSAEELAAMPDRLAATFTDRSVLVTGGTGFIGKVLVEKLLRYDMSSYSPELAAMPDRIATTFTDHSVLVTGGTGFIGKVLVEKLLRKCPDIKQILLLVRPKKGKTPRDRLEDIVSDPLFDMVRGMRGGVQPLLDKLTLVSGDTSEPDLALSAEDRQRVIDDTHVIVHAAASVRFDEEMRPAVLLNVRGTKLVLQLARECRQLLLFLHISTAYSHPHARVVEEKTYPPPTDPHQTIAAMEWMDDDMVAALTPKLLRNLPNVYTFTKALSEALVEEAMEDITAVILRPSIVIPVWQEPLPGWAPNINGPIGLFIGAGKGVIRSMYCKSHCQPDLMPADVFANAIMLVVWQFLDRGVRDIKVMNITSSSEIKSSWEELLEVAREVCLKRVPLNRPVWYPGGSIKHSVVYHYICLVLFHWLPAVLVDCLIFCLGYPPVLCRVQRRIYKGMEMVEYYATHDWEFRADIGIQMRNDMNARERQDYKVDSVGLDIDKYLEDCTLGARRYILKETDDTLPAARRHMKILWWVDVLFRASFWALLLYCLRGWLARLLAPTLNGFLTVNKIQN